MAATQTIELVYSCSDIPPRMSTGSMPAPVSMLNCRRGLRAQSVCLVDSLLQYWLCWSCRICMGTPPESACQSYTALAGTRDTSNIPAWHSSSWKDYSFSSPGFQAIERNHRPSRLLPAELTTFLFHCKSTGSESSCGPGSTSICLCLRNSLEHRLIIFLSAKHWGSRAELLHIIAYNCICTSSGYRCWAPKLQNNREDQNGPYCASSQLWLT